MKRGVRRAAAGLMIGSVWFACVSPALGAQDGTAAARGEIADVSALLDALEVADAGVSTFQARVMYDRVLRLQGDRIVRIGGLAFRVDTPAQEGRPARRTFAVNFDQVFIGEALRNESLRMVFDGEWLVEQNEREKRHVARQVALAEDPIDPLRLGEGPMPLPIGQRKEDIQMRFEAELLAPGAGLEAGEDAGEEAQAQASRRLAFVAETYQLRLVPREAFVRELDFVEVRLWYDRRTMLPRLARTITTAGDVAWVQLIGVRTNEPLPGGVMEIEPPEGDEWQVEVIPYRRHAGEGE